MKYSQEALEAKRAKISLLRQRLSKLTPEEREAFISRGIISTVNGHPLSPQNIILCNIQREGVSVVAGYRQWQQAGRQVSKGETGMFIWVPTTKTPNREKQNNGEETQPEIQYTTVTVFDIIQTYEVEQKTTGQ